MPVNIGKAKQGRSHTCFQSIPHDAALGERTVARLFAFGGLIATEFVGNLFCQRGNLFGTDSERPRYSPCAIRDSVSAIA